MRLFCDPLAKHFAGPYGKRVSEMLACGLKSVFDPTGEVGLGFEGPEYFNGNSAFRIAHMGHLNPHMLLGVLASLEMGLMATNIPFKKGGLDNAINYLANSINNES